MRIRRPGGHVFELKKDDLDAIGSLAENLRCVNPELRFNKDALVANIKRRMVTIGVVSLSEYLSILSHHEDEVQKLISSVTQTTKSWFSEGECFKIIERRISESIGAFRQNSFSAMIIACATGEEAYSFGLLLEHLRYFYSGFDYSLLATDIDQGRIAFARRAVFDVNAGFHHISKKYAKYISKGAGKSEGKFTVCEPIRKRCQFKLHDIRQKSPEFKNKFELIVFRNALAYFDKQQSKEIIDHIGSFLTDDGILVLGETEEWAINTSSMEKLSASCFVKKGHKTIQRKGKKHQVLIVDDSPVDRSILGRKLEKHDFIIHEASSGKEATKFLEKTRVDLISLDLHMPEMSGQDWVVLQRKQGLQTPIVIISGSEPDEAQRVLDSLGSGAQDFFSKSALKTNFLEIVERFETLISAAHKGKEYDGKILSVNDLGNKLIRPELIVMGASTGGTEALIEVLMGMPEDSPPVMVVQHIVNSFADAYYSRLAFSSRLKKVEPQNEMNLKRGHLYMASGDYHIGVRQKGNNLVLKIDQHYSLGSHRPSVDFLFKSASKISSQVTGILLTGMGKDGAKGLADLRKNGAVTYAQDEASCAVFGMPKEAIELGAAKYIMNLQGIRKSLRASITSGHKES